MDGVDGMDPVDGVDGMETKGKEIEMAGRVCGMCGEVKKEFCHTCSTTPHYECSTMAQVDYDVDFKPEPVASGHVCLGCCWCHLRKKSRAAEVRA